MNNTIRSLLLSICLLLFPPSGNCQSTLTEGKPTVVFIFAKTCKFCAQVRPIIDQLESQYQTKVNFLRLDVTDGPARKHSREVAKACNFRTFLAYYEDVYPAVGVFNAKGKCLKEFYGINAKERMVAAIEQSLRCE